MTDAYHDENGKPTLICASSDDGTTIVKITADPSNHAMSVNDDVTGGDNGNNSGNAMVDGNGVPVLIALSSKTITVNGVDYIQGVTPVEIYGDPATGKVFITSS